MLRVVHITAELDGFHKTGGLGDAVLGLARAQADFGHDVLVVIPKTGITQVPSSARVEGDVLLRARHGTTQGLARGILVRLSKRLRVCMVERDDLFLREGLYGDRRGGFADNLFRFVAFSQYALEATAALVPEVPDVLHAHDWHAASSLLIVRTLFQWSKPRLVFTLHNAAHQGAAGTELLTFAGLPDAPWLHHDGQLNLVKGAVNVCDAWTTVSPRHAWELTTAEGGFGLDQHFYYHRAKLTGVLNGVTPRRAPPESLDEVKLRAKQTLLASMHLDAARPLFAFVGRLAHQKGADLLFACTEQLVVRGANLVVLGVGEPALEEAAMTLQRRFPDAVRTCLAFDPALSERMYEGADAMVVPSRFEPCGLVQLYAMQCGTVPIVTRTGGLMDTVHPLARGYSVGDGFLADPGDVASLKLALDDACTLLHDQTSLSSVRSRISHNDFSWARAAMEYEHVYNT